MSILNPQQEDLVCKWIAAEALYFLKDRHTGNRTEWINNFQTRVNKIIYNIAENHDLNITRSWYLYGGFIHEYNFENDFRSLAKSYLSTSQGPIHLKSKAIGILGDVTEIINDIHKISDEIDSLTVDDYLFKFYQEEAPEPYKNAYLSKHQLTNGKSVISQLINAGRFKTGYLRVALDNLDKIYDDITDFQSAVYSFNNERVLDRNTMMFFNVLEDAIRKLELWHRYEAAADFTSSSFYEESKKVFIDYVWKPYACEITKDTVIGLRAKDVKTKAQDWKRDTLKKFDSKLKSLEQHRNQAGLMMDRMESKEYLGRLSEDDVKLLKLISAYDDIKE
jgi:hypothetical protein